MPARLGGTYVPLMDSEAVRDSRFNAPAQPAVPASARPLATWVRWARDLLIRPASFFRQHADQPLPIVTFVAAYVYGVAGMIDRLGVHALRADALQ